MLTLRTGPAAGLTAQAALLVALDMVVGLSGFGWFVGIGCAVMINAAVAIGLSRSGGSVLGPADVVTLVRAILSCGVAALVVDSFLGGPAVATLVTLSTAALMLDAIDGWVARRTRTASRFGARFDGEVDAFLILVLSVYAAPAFGGWVLTIGLARYAFAAAGWVLPWLRGQLPPRYWRKVVAAVQGIVLTIAAADVLPRAAVYAALVVALAMLTESFGRDVWWRWRHGSADVHAVTKQREQDEPEIAGHPAAPPRPRWRIAVTVLTNLLALLLVWFALVAPNRAHRLAPEAFLRLPAEGLLVAALAIVLPSLGRRIMAALVGLLLGLLTIIRLLDMGFFAAFDRPFNLVTDRGYFGSAVDLVRDEVGSVGADIVVVLVVVLVVALLVFLPLAVGRLTGLLARHRRWSMRAVTGLVVVWMACALSGLQIQTGEPVASLEAGHLALGQVRAITDGVQDQERFDAAAAVDDFSGAADSELLTGLRGKDVLVVFVESYGRVALEGPRASAPVRAVLDAGTDRLSAAGYSTKSAFLTSPTFGGLSWLAHATLQSGLWVDNQPRYDRLISSQRMTLTRAFDRAGWRTVAVLPSNREKWPEGKAFYQIDKIYGRRNTGYDGPRWGFSRMPDQYALAAFQRLELATADRTPVMAEIDLASSHAPWAPVPRMVDWNALGDGTMFNRIHDQSESAKDLWRHHEDVPGAYAGSIAYSLQALISFVQHYGDDDLVMVLLGDHQPAPIVSGHGASHDVPITVVAHDPAVIDRISAWGWQDGMRPDPLAPVWRMDAFRDRFLAAYSPELARTAAKPGSP